MDKRVLIIGQKDSAFFLKTIEDTLRKQNFTIDIIEPVIASIERLEAVPQVLLFYVDESVFDDVALLIYLRDYSTDNDIKICVAGYTNEVEFVRNYLPVGQVWDTFYRPLNLHDVANSIIEASNSNEEDDSGEGRKQRILLVDDNPGMLRMITNWLSDHYTVSIANSAAMAIGFLTTNRVDLILLDYEMPVCNGTQFLEMIQSEPLTRDIPVIFLTGKSNAQVVKDAIALKPAGYLLKSQGKELIVDYVDEFFAKQALLRSQRRPRGNH